ncbi:hypothetical protein [Rhodococcus koreensis]
MLTYHHHLVGAHSALASARPNHSKKMTFGIAHHFDDITLFYYLVE